MKKITFWGKLTGIVIGAFSGLGLYGVIVGVLIGHLVDMYLKQRKLKSLAAEFYSNPEQISLPPRDFLLVSASGLAAFVSGLDSSRIDYAEELISGILQVHLSLSGKETESVKEFLENYFNTPEPDPAAVARVFAASGPKKEADIALISALIRIEERTEITWEKTKFIRDFSLMLKLPEDDFHSLRRHFLGVSLENYEILGIPVDSSTDEIKRIYRNLVAFFHPDGASELNDEQKKESGEAFITIQKAYEEIMKERGNP